MKIVMLRSIKPAINLKNNSEKLLYRFIRSFIGSVGFLWFSSIFYALNDNSEKENTLRVLSFIYMELQVLLSGQPS